MTANELTVQEPTSAPLATRGGREAHLDEWVAPDIADEQGFLRAGKILEWMDVVGVLAASRHCRCPVATASVDGMELRHPIRVGERVSCWCQSQPLGVAIGAVAAHEVVHTPGQRREWRGVGRGKGEVEPEAVPSVAAGRPAIGDRGPHA